MVGKRITNIEEIRAYLKVCTELSHLVMHIVTELLEVYGSDKVLDFYETVCMWRMKVLTGT